jgi:hypothetical protein
MQEWAVSAKRLVDLYLAMAAHRVWQEMIVKAKAQRIHLANLNIRL